MITLYSELEVSAVKVLTSLCYQCVRQSLPICSHVQHFIKKPIDFEEFLNLKAHLKKISQDLIF